jgi:S-adenosylmethionine-dependent methyltransferase
MKRHTPPFEQAGEQFAENYYSQTRGYIRREVTRLNLLEHIGPVESLAVLDFGTGDGKDALWLAEQGHDVLGVDESVDMLQRANANLHDRDAVIQDHVKFASGLPPEIDALPYESYDLVLSHGVLQYELEDPLGQLVRLGERLKPGGMLSLLTKNRRSAEGTIKAPSSLAVFKQTGIFFNNLGIESKAYSLNEVHLLLSQAGFVVARDYGVRIHSNGDGEDLDSISPRKLSAILAMEVADSREPGLVEDGRMIHTIAIRNS